MPGVIDPSVSAVAEARAGAPRPQKAAAIAAPQPIDVAQGAIATATVTIVQGRAQGHDAVQGGVSEGPVEVGSIARIPWEVVSTAEVTSHGGRSGEGVEYILKSKLPKWRMMVSSYTGLFIPPEGGLVRMSSHQFA